MVGALIIAFILVVAIPVGFLITTGILAAVLGYTVKTDVDKRFADTEYLDLS
jgi:hypothetical protein